MKYKLFFLIISILLSIEVHAGSGTGVGNGGDPLFSFLSSTRFVYTEVLKDFNLDPSIRDSFCKTQNHLNLEQEIFCREFLMETHLQILGLNEDPNKTDFVIRQEPLLVEGPDGKLMPVAAKTSLGAEGVIEFHRSSIIYYPPRQMLLLIAHEFGHKALFRGRSVTDNEKIGPFSSGRELLDTVAEAIVSVAEARGRIGKSFGLRDFWQCQILFKNGPVTGANAASLRMFYKNSFDQFESGISRSPDDPQIFVYESLNSRLVFRIRIQERLGCLKDALEINQRNTKLEIFRVREKRSNKDSPQEEIVNSIDLPLVNPICEEKPRWLELSADGVNFRCKYSGSQGGFQ